MAEQSLNPFSLCLTIVVRLQMVFGLRCFKRFFIYQNNDVNNCKNAAVNASVMLTVSGSCSLEMSRIGTIFKWVVPGLFLSLSSQYS